MPAPLETAQTCALETLLRIATKPSCSRTACCRTSHGLWSVRRPESPCDDFAEGRRGLSHAVDLDVSGLTNGMMCIPADLDPLQLGLPGSSSCHGDVGFEPQHVRRSASRISDPPAGRNRPAETRPAAAPARTCRALGHASRTSPVSAGVVRSRARSRLKEASSSAWRHRAPLAFRRRRMPSTWRVIRGVL